MAKRRVRVGKIDLDTCGAAFLLGVTREDEVEVLRGGQATEADLANPDVLCIEVGGSGRVAEGDFDHHGPEGAGLPSATYQVWSRRMKEEGPESGRQLSPGEHLFPFTLFIRIGMKAANWVRGPATLAWLVDYIHRLDVEGPAALALRAVEAQASSGRRLRVGKPTLSDVFAGLLLAERDPVKQLHAGVEILQEVVRRVIHPYGQMPVEEIPAWATYAEAKAENNRQIAKAVESAQWGATSSGLKLAWLETDFFGAPGALYGVGAQVVVAYSRHFGPAGVPKFTIAGNGIRVDAVLPELNAREPGWGGPPTGTILGSLREGSRMTLDEVVEIVRRVL